MAGIIHMKVFLAGWLNKKLKQRRAKEGKKQYLKELQVLVAAKVKC